MKNLFILLFAEVYSNIGYAWTQLSTYYPAEFYAYAGVGVGVKFHPVGFDNSKLLKKIDLNAYIRKPLISSLPPKNVDIKVGFTYRF